MRLRWPTWCYGLYLIAPARSAKSNSLALEALNLDPSQANQVLARKIRSNNGVFEELGAANFQEECINERCSAEELQETINQDASTEAEKETLGAKRKAMIFNRCWYNVKHEPELACTQFGTKTCRPAYNDQECVCRPKWSGDRCETSECWDIDQIGRNDDSGKCVPIPTEPKHQNWKIDPKTNTYQPDGCEGQWEGEKCQVNGCHSKGLRDGNLLPNPENKCVSCYELSEFQESSSTCTLEPTSNSCQCSCLPHYTGKFCDRLKTCYETENLDESLYDCQGQPGETDCVCSARDPCLEPERCPSDEEICVRDDFDLTKFDCKSCYTYEDQDVLTHNCRSYENRCECSEKENPCTTDPNICGSGKRCQPKQGIEYDCVDICDKETQLWDEISETCITKYIDPCENFVCPSNSDKVISKIDDQICECQCHDSKYWGGSSDNLCHECIDHSVGDSCQNGYHCRNNKCQDVDECLSGVHDCKVDQQECINTAGSFHCNDIQVNECENDADNNCDKRYQRCRDMVKGYECDDIDECRLGTDECDRETQRCVNIVYDPIFLVGRDRRRNGMSPGYKCEPKPDPQCRLQHATDDRVTDTGSKCGQDSNDQKPCLDSKSAISSKCLDDNGQTSFCKDDMNENLCSFLHSCLFEMNRPIYDHSGARELNYNQDCKKTCAIALSDYLSQGYDKYECDNRSDYRKQRFFNFVTDRSPSCLCTASHKASWYYVKQYEGWSTYTDQTCDGCAHFC